MRPQVLDKPSIGDPDHEEAGRATGRGAGRAVRERHRVRGRHTQSVTRGRQEIGRRARLEPFLGEQVGVGTLVNQALQVSELKHGPGRRARGNDR